MTIEDKIRKRIKTMEMLKNEPVKEIQISKEESEKLGDRKVLDGVILIVVDKLGDRTKKDCFAYIDRNGHDSCFCLDNLYCRKEKCNFYRTDITVPQIEASVKRYSMK